MVGIKFIILKAACQSCCVLEMKAKLALEDDCFVLGKNTDGPLLSEGKALDLVWGSGTR